MGFGERVSQRVKCPFNTLTGPINDGISHDRLAREVFARFLRHSVAFSPIQYSVIRKEVTKSRSYSRREDGIKLHLLEWEVFTYIVWNPSVRKICLFPLFIQLFICFSMDSPIYFIFWVII